MGKAKAQSNGWHTGRRFNPAAIQTPRHDTAAEAAVLGSMLRENAIIGDVCQAVSKDDFHSDANQKIFDAIVGLHDRGDPADLVTVAHVLRERGQIEDIGNYPALAALLDAAPAWASWPAYAGIVRDHALRRGLTYIGQDILRDAQQGRAPVAELLDTARDAIGLLTRTAPLSAPRARVEIDAAELALSRDCEHLPFLPFLGQEGYLVKGWSHIVASYPRLGKTELLAACCRDWLTLGERVLYFTEEPEAIWAHRLARAPAAWQGMKLFFGLGIDVGVMLARMRAGTETIVIVDTIRNLGLVPRDECDNSEVARALAPWVATARQKQQTLAFSHHDRKGGGEHGEGIAGGHAFLGCVDIALEIRPDSAHNRRLVKARCRLIQPPELMYERRDDGAMHALGTPDAIGLQEVRRRVLDALDTDDWLKTAEVRVRLEEPLPSLPNIRDALAAEAREGTIERDPPLSAGSATGKTVRWRLLPQT